MDVLPKHMPSVGVCEDCKGALSKHSHRCSIELSWVGDSEASLQDQGDQTEEKGWDLRTGYS